MLDDLNKTETERLERLNQSRFKYEQGQDSAENSYTDSPTRNDRPKIGNAMAFFMLAAAGSIDLIQIVLEWIVVGFFINWAIDIGAWVLFFLWFKSRGVSFMNIKKAGVFTGLAFLEIIPVVDELPLWVLDILLMIAIVKVENKKAAIS